MVNWLPSGQSRYHVHRIECWGGVYRYVVRDYLHNREVGSPCNLERSAKKRADRLNADWRRFEKASTSDHYVGYVNARK